MPGPKVSNEQLEDWLAKDDGEGIPVEVAFAHLKKELAAKKEQEKWKSKFVSVPMNALRRTADYVESMNTPGSGGPVAR